MDTLTRDTAKSYLWNQIAVTFDGLTLTLGSILVGRLLGEDALGAFGWVVLSAVGLVTLAAGLGLKEGVTILVQRVEADGAGLKGLFRACLRIRVISALIAAAVAATLFSLLGGIPYAASAVASLYVVFVLISGFLSSFNIALFQTRTVAIGKVLSSLITLALVVAAGLSKSLTLVFAGFAAGSLAGIAVFFVPLARLASGPARIYPFRKLLDLSLSFWLLGFFNYILAAQTVPFILKLAASAQIGVFTAAFTVAAVANRAFMGGFANVSLAAFGRAAESGGEAFARMHSLYVRATAMLGVPILLGAMVFSPLLARIPLKSENPAVVSLIIILAGAFLLNRLLGGGAHSNALYASGLHRPALALRAAFAALSFAAVYLAAVTGGTPAAAAAAGASGVAVVAAEYAYLRYSRGTKMPWRPLTRLALACGAVALVAAVILSQGGVFAAVFAVVVFVVGSFCALAVAHPLERGETALMGVTGRLAKAMLLFEAPAGAVASPPRRSWLLAACAVIVIASAAALRIPCLSADPPHGLSSSRAEYTDEGLKFYQARNRALFGQWRIDTPWAMQGHLANSPVPTVLAWRVFQLFGTGRVQLRCMSVVCGVLSCTVILLIGFRSGELLTGLLAAVFAAANYILVSYDRLALFESLFILLLLCAAFFYLEGGWRRWTLAPVFLVLAYLTRASAALLAAAFACALATELWRKSAWRSRRKAAVLVIVCAALALAVLVLLRFCPGNQIAAQARARFDTPYFRVFPVVIAAADLMVRSFPDSLLAVSMPLLSIVALTALSSAAVRGPNDPARAPRLLFFWWFLAAFFLVAFLEYRPTRYYVLFVPAICYLAAGWIVGFARGRGDTSLASRNAAVWLFVRFLAGVEIVGVVLRYVVASRHELPLLFDIDSVGLKALKDFVESRFIGAPGVLQPGTPQAARALAAEMLQHVLNLALLGLVVLALSILWLLARRRLFASGLPPRVRLALGVLLAFAILVGQGGLVRDSLAYGNRRYEVQHAGRTIAQLVGDNPRACIAGNWAPALCMDTSCFTMPFARGNGNAWDTFRRFPVTHFVLELGSPNEELYLARAYPAQFERCRLLETFNMDFYRIGLFEYTPPEGVPRPDWPLRKEQKR